MNGRELFEEGQKAFVTGRHQESIEKFTAALEAGHDEIATRLSRGAAHLQLQELSQALEDFNRVLVLEPRNERARYYRGIAWLNQERYEEALADLDKAIAANPGRGAAFLGRGLARAELGQEENALEDFKTAVAHSTAEVERFLQSFGAARTRFQRAMALLEGERGPREKVLTREEAETLREWLEPAREQEPA